MTTHKGSLETIPIDKEVIPSLMGTTNSPDFRRPTSTSRRIRPAKKGVACTQKKKNRNKHRHKERERECKMKTGHWQVFSVEQC